MCEVTSKNFNKLLPEIETVLKNAKFITLDTEFSCLTASNKVRNSLFDSAHDRYSKLRCTVEQMIPLQIGLSAFTFNADNNSYTGHCYNFYIFPRAVSFLDRSFLCQSSSLQFLANNKFDFNKLVYEGISYLNRPQEEKLLKYLRIEDGVLLDNLSTFEKVFDETQTTITNWITKAQENDVLLIQELQQHSCYPEIIYNLHKELRQKFIHLWTFEDIDGFKVQKTTREDYEKLSKENNLEELLVSNLLGFSKLIRLLSRLQKPIIGHNCLLDLMIVIQNFEQPLPKSYSAFKKLVHSLFPTVYDTKCITYDIKSLLSDNTLWNKNVLEDLFDFFKNGNGRHAASNSPVIEPAGSDDLTQHFHSAGWDSFCTGYIFIRMAHIFAADKWKNKRKKFMNVELLQSISHLKNIVNVISGDLSHIKLDGDDPASNRPPWLIVKGIRQPININQLTSLLSNFGFVEVKPYWNKRDQAIVAVGNFGSAKKILSQFNSHTDYKIQQYNFLKHSPVAKAAFWSSFVVSSALLTWYGLHKLN